MEKRIPLFWWSEIRFISKKKENYGDLLSKYLVERISCREVNWVHPKKQPWYKLNKNNFVAIGSIIHHVTKNSIVWGSGIIDRTQPVERADFRAVRGPQTRKFLKELNYECPEIYGDPAILLPLYYKPDVKKKYKLGIIAHYNDFTAVSNWYKEDKDISVIDLMTMDVEDVTRQILECEATISSSLHGIIVSHAYQIPSVWVKFSNNIFGDGIKYRDYLESVEIPFYNAPFLAQKRTLTELEKVIETYPNIPEVVKMQETIKNLLASCPFIAP